jgi:probable rRNA maturation factor
MPVAIFHYPKKSPVSIFKLKSFLEELLSYLKQENAHLEVSFVGNKAIRSLNQRYRKKDAVTDVLSFPLDREPTGKGFPWHLGEIVIATPVARQQAQQARRNFTQQVLRLAIHGLVHLKGLDHDKSISELKRFQSLEKRCLQHLAKKGMMPWDGSLLL